MKAKSLISVEVLYKGIKLNVTGIYYHAEADTNVSEEFDPKEITVYDSFENIIELLSEEDVDSIVECVYSLI